MKDIYLTVLPYLETLDKHPSFPVPKAIREKLHRVVASMQGCSPDTVVSDWVRRQLRQASRAE